MQKNYYQMAVITSDFQINLINFVWNILFRDNWQEIDRKS